MTGADATSAGTASQLASTAALRCIRLRSISASSGIAVAWPLGLIAGNGRFPCLVLDAARALGRHVTVVAIKEEAEPTWPTPPRRAAPTLHWVSLGQLGAASSC